MDRRLAVVILGSFPPQTQGIQNYCGELASALAETCEVTGVGFKKMYPAFLFPGVQEPMDETRGVIEKDGLRIQNTLTYYNVLNWIWTAWRLPADVFHVQWWSLPLWPVCVIMASIARLKGTKVVVTIHNVLPHERRGLFIVATKALCRLAHEIIVHGEENMNDAIRTYGFDAKKIHNVPHGIFTELAVRHSKLDARAELGLAPESKILLFFGIIRDYKGVDLLLRAAAQAMDTHPEIHVVIAGKPWTDWDPYERLMESLNIASSVRLYLEYIPANKVASYFSASDLVVLPYRRFNAQSGVAALSVAYHCPTIVTRVGGLSACVDHHEQWVVEPEDVDGLQTKILDFFDNQRDREREFEHIVQRVCDEMSWPRIAEKHMAIYSHALYPSKNEVPSDIP